MKKLLYFFLLYFFNNYVKCIINSCFEYSCEECETEQYGKCTKCREGFKLIDGTCPCLDSSCALCDKKLSTFQECYQCKNGYYNIDSKCYCDIENCNQCGDFGCLKCNYGYNYNAESESCEKINCNNPNCELCFSQNSGECFICKEGYTLSNGECSENTGTNDNIGNCPVIDSSYCYKQCDGIDCTEVHILNGEIYHKCASNDCLICKDNILYTIDNCENSQLCNKEGCMVCKTNEKCYKCRQGYRFDNGDCIKCSKGCSKCRGDDKCDYCLSGYQLNSDMQCILSNTFDFNINIYKSKKKTLINLYYPELDYNEQDIECDPNCEKCYENTGVCKECKTNYKLVDNNCIYECSSPNCVCHINDCEKCSNSKPNSCIQCKNGRHLIDGRCWNTVNSCQEKIPECILCNGYDKCYSCSNNYALDEEQESCIKKKDFTLIISLTISSVCIILGVLFVIYYLKKRRRRENDNNDNHNNNNIIDNNINSNEVLSLNRRKKLQKEFDNISNKLTINSQSTEKCNICYKNDGTVAHFKCQCSINVCRECYVQCKMTSNKCPGCRAII